MAKIALIIYGSPGSGKGTQANLAADHLGLIHIDTGKFLESIVHDPTNADDSTIQKERHLFDTGILLTPSWVLKMIKKKAEEVARAGYGIVFSGSPRTMYEAKGLIPKLEKLYGKKNIFPVVLKVKPQTSMARNSQRLLCSYCGMTIMTTLLKDRRRHTFCVFCGAPFKKRTLDKPEVIRVRLKEFKERTMPIFSYLKSRGYKLIEINGEPIPYVVSGVLLEEINERLKHK